MSNNSQQEQEQAKTPTENNNVNIKKLEQDYTYEEPDSDSIDEYSSTVDDDDKEEDNAELSPETLNALRSMPNITAYTTAVKNLAQQKAFHIQFLDGKKKVFQRRKAGMKEVIELERRRAIMKGSKGTPLQVAQALAEFYYYSSQVHLIDTRTGKPMTKSEYENVLFEDFRKIIDACEYVMLFGIPS